MRVFRLVLCLFLALSLCTGAAASGVESAVSQLTDESLMELYGVIIFEMYSRGLSPDAVADYVIRQYHAGQQPETAAPSFACDPALQDMAEYVNDLLSDPAYAEAAGTFVTYDPPATPKPTFAPLIQLEMQDRVWISRTGRRYHTMPDCSGMQTAREVTLAEALSKGLTPCRDCAYWLAEMEK